MYGKYQDTMIEYLQMQVKALRKELIPLLVQHHMEGTTTYLDVLDRGVIDVNVRGHWPNDSGCETTLLLSAIEHRDLDLVDGLLKRGADVTAIDNNGMGVIDTLLWGHSHCSTHDVCLMEFAQTIWTMLEPYNPPLKIKAVTLSEFENSWEYKDHPEKFKALIDLVATCTVE